MASASVVGQHPGPHGLDSEPPRLLRLKLAGGTKKSSLPRKPSWERMVCKRGAGSSPEPAAVSAEEGESGSRRRCPGEPVAGGERLSGEGRVAPAATRSPDRDARGGCGAAAATGDGRTGRTGGDRPRGVYWDSNRGTGGRSGSSSQTAGVIPGRPARDERRRGVARRDTWSGSSAERVPASGPPPPGRSRALPLERLTQGRTGVVRLARTEPPRREAWSIFPRGMDPRVRTERGEGHRFEAKPVTQDWCDACSRQIRAQTLKCQNCSYTCHLECERSIQLDCNQRDKEAKQTPSPRIHCSSSTPQHRQNEAQGEEGRGTTDLSEEELRTRIEAYNAQVSEDGMKMASDGSFNGFIKIHLRLSRPVTVLSAQPEGASRPTDDPNTAVCESPEETDSGRSDSRTSFYLPSDSLKQLHISSLNTTREVIRGLLKKYMVLDNPCKFALYRQTHRDGQDLFQKLPLCERPLLLQLIEGPDPKHLSFVLKENETGEVEWHAFSVPELQNFLVILEKEEAERVRAVEQKYVMYRQKLQQALQKHDP